MEYLSFKLISISILFFITSGCDTFYGVTRQAKNIPIIPNYDCVLHAINKVEQVKFIGFEKIQGGIPITMTGIKKMEINQYYSYEFGQLRGMLWFNKKYNNEKSMSQNYLDVNNHPAQEDIDRIRPIMIKIENGLEEECNVKGLKGRVQEICLGVICKDVILND